MLKLLTGFNEQNNQKSIKIQMCFDNKKITPMNFNNGNEK